MFSKNFYDFLVDTNDAKYKKGYGRNYSRSIGTLCLLQNREGHIRRIQQKQLPS